MNDCDWYLHWLCQRGEKVNMSGLCLCLYSGITYRWVFVLRILFRQIYIILFLSCSINCWKTIDIISGWCWFQCDWDFKSAWMILCFRVLIVLCDLTKWNRWSRRSIYYLSCLVYSVEIYMIFHGLMTYKEYSWDIECCTRPWMEFVEIIIIYIESLFLIICLLVIWFLIHDCNVSPWDWNSYINETQL